MSKWAEFLGNDYMTTHGRNVSTYMWAEGMRQAMNELLHGVGFYDKVEFKRFAHQYPFTNEIDSAINYGIVPKEFDSDVSEVGDIENLTLEKALEMIGDSIRLSPNFADHRYWWQSKRLLDCAYMSFSKGASYTVLTEHYRNDYWYRDYEQAKQNIHEVYDGNKPEELQIQSHGVRYSGDYPAYWIFNAPTSATASFKAVLSQMNSITDVRVLMSITKPTTFGVNRYWYPLFEENAVVQFLAKNISQSGSYTLAEIPTFMSLIDFELPESVPILDYTTYTGYEVSYEGVLFDRSSCEFLDPL